MLGLLEGDLVCHRVRMPDRGWDYVRELGCGR